MIQIKKRIAPIIFSFTFVLALLGCVKEETNESENIGSKRTAEQSNSPQLETSVNTQNSVEKDTQDVNIILNFNSVNKPVKLRIKTASNSVVRLYGFDLEKMAGNGEPVSLLITKPEAGISGNLTGFICSNNDLLTGIEIINAPVMEILDCSFTKLKNINIQKAENLSTLNFENCSELNNLSTDSFFKLKNLNVQNTEIKNLDVKKNTELKNLNCSGSNITALNISANKKIETLDCSRLNLRTLNLKNNARLKNLNCSSNKLKDLDISYNPALVSLQCRNNSLSDLAVFKNTELQLLNCGKNNLQRLFIDLNLNLKSLFCDNNKLEQLDISGNKNIEELYCYANRLKILTLDKNLALKHLFCFDNFIGEAEMKKLFSDMPAGDGYDLQTAVLYAEENPDLSYDTKMYYEHNYKPTEDMIAEASMKYWNVYFTKYGLEEPEEILRTIEQKN